MLEAGGAGKGRGMPRHRRQRHRLLPHWICLALYTCLTACRRQGLCGMPGLEELQRCRRAAQCRCWRASSAACTTFRARRGESLAPHCQAYAQEERKGRLDGGEDNCATEASSHPMNMH